MGRNSENLAGYDVFALEVLTEGRTTPEIFGIFSNAYSCCERGEKICDSYAKAGIIATYKVRSYTVEE